MIEGLSQITPEEIKTNGKPLGENEQQWQEETVADHEGQESISDSSPLPEKGTELELTPELLSIILAKVQDINRDGVAFSSMPRERFKSAFEEGLLGTDDHPHPEDKDERRRQWAERARKRDVKNCIVWFNITGRMELPYTDTPPFKQAHWVGKNTVAFIFDISSFKEISAAALKAWDRYSHTYQETFGKTTRPSTRTFVVNDGARGKGGFVEDFEIFNEETGRHTRSTRGNRSDYGFMTSFRVSPVLFEGLVVGEQITEDVDDIVKTMLETGSPDRVIPIYDRDGNLIWPQNMTNAEVKEFVRAQGKEGEEQDKKLLEEKVRFLAKNKSIMTIGDFKIPDNVNDVIPDVLAEDDLQMQLAETILYDTLPMQSPKRFDSKCERYLQQFSIKSENIKKVVIGDPVRFTATYPLSIAQESDFNKIINLSGFTQNETKEAFYNESNVEQLFLNAGNVEQWNSCCQYLENLFGLSDEEITQNPQFIAFIHSNFLGKYGHIPPMARFLTKKYGIEKEELGEKSIANAVNAIVNHCFNPSGCYTANDYLETFSDDMFNNQMSRDQFLEKFESYLTWGTLNRSPKEYFELMHIDYLQYFSSQRFHDLLVERVKKEYEDRGRKRDVYYEEDVVRFFHGLNRCIGDDLSFDRTLYEEEADMEAAA